MGFGQGLSGLNAASQNLDVIGNNIANSSTVGFKASSASFADVYASSRVGLGVGVSGINQKFTNGNVRTTGNQFDIAIDGEKGLFRLTDQSGATVYSRNGEFKPDKNLWIVNAQGQQLTGYVDGKDIPEPLRVPTGNIAPQPTSRVEFGANFDANKPALGPERLGNVTLATNAVPGSVELTDASSNAVTYHFTGSPTNPTWVNADGTTAGAPTPAAGTYGTVVIDGSGQPTNANGLEGGGSYQAFTPQGPDVTYYFKEGANGAIEWVDANGVATAGPANGAYNNSAVTIPSGGVSDLAAGGNYQAYTPAVVTFDPTDPSTYTNAQPMTVFDSVGNAHQATQYFVNTGKNANGNTVWQVHYRVDGSSTAAGPFNLEFDKSGKLTGTNADQRNTVTFPMDQISGAVNDLEIQFDYAGSTQFAGAFTVTPTQNGYATGEYASMSIAADGTLVANYTNGETKEVGVIALANFNNLQGLQPIGGNAWRETAESGQPIVGRPGENGLASLKGQSVEESNVDMSQELVNMIIAQRTYQANAQTIKTQDQILQTLITLR